MSQTPWLSILIPVYNVEAYLEACVDSVRSQQLDGVEILLLDDASTDGSALLMQELANGPGAPLRLLKHERNAGLSAARNTLMEASRGDYLWFLDSDDLLMPGAVAGLRAVLNKAAADLVVCDFQTVREPMRLKHKLRGELHRRVLTCEPYQLSQDRAALLSDLFMQGHLHSWSKIARRSLWGEDLRFPAQRYFEDMATTPELALRARSFVYAPEVWVGYRQRPGSILSSSNVKKCDDMMIALAGLPGRLAAEPGLLTPALSFSASCFAAKSFIGACRIASAQGDQPRLRQYLQNFRDSAPLAPTALIGQYRRRGWFMRALRLRNWIARCGH